MTRTILLTLAVLFLLPACATNKLLEETSEETDVTWTQSRVADVAVDKTGTLHVVIEGDNGEFYVFGAHQSTLDKGLERCYINDILESDGRLPSICRSDQYTAPKVTIEQDPDTGKSQIVLAPADGSTAGKSDMNAKTRERGMGGWVAVALLSPLTLAVDTTLKAKQMASPAVLISKVKGAVTSEEVDPNAIPKGCTCERPHAAEKPAEK